MRQLSRTWLLKTHRAEGAVRSCQFLWRFQTWMQGRALRGSCRKWSFGQPWDYACQGACTQRAKLAALGQFLYYYGLYKNNAFSSSFLHVTRRTDIQWFFFWAKEGHCPFLQAVPGKEGEKIWISLYQRQDTSSQKLFQLQTSLEMQDPQLEFHSIWAPKGPVLEFQPSGACILMIMLLLGWEISALTGQKRNLLIQCLGFILATLS